MVDHKYLYCFLLIYNIAALSRRVEELTIGFERCNIQVPNCFEHLSYYGAKYKPTTVFQYNIIIIRSFCYFNNAVKNETSNAMQVCAVINILASQNEISEHIIVDE